MLRMSKLREAFCFRHFLIGLGIATVAALAFRALSGLPFWGCLAIAVGAMLVNGLAEWEDNQPGGFNNPMPDNPSHPTRLVPTFDRAPIRFPLQDVSRFLLRLLAGQVECRVLLTPAKYGAPVDARVGCLT
jgi:hypothetical protein